MKKFLFTALLLLAVSPLMAESVMVTILHDETFDNRNGIIERMQNNLSAVLSEINTANDQNRILNVAGLAMTDDAKSTLVMLWNNIHFYVDDTEVIERCWPLKSGYMLRQIPLIVNNTGESFGNGNYQEACVEFDKQGRITDFRFVFDSHQYESMEKCGQVVELERELQILAYCDRFATAYCTKDMDFLRQVFSEDALIITGKVVTTRPSEMSPGGQKIEYSRQNKQQYLTNLARAFRNNRYIKVTFDKIGSGGKCGPVTRSAADPNIYGVRLVQHWRSSNYNDDGYLFLLWDFNDPDHPQIHVRTWQPTLLNGKELPEDDIFSLSDFDL